MLRNRSLLGLDHRRARLAHGLGDDLRRAAVVRPRHDRVDGEASAGCSRRSCCRSGSSASRPARSSPGSARKRTMLDLRRGARPADARDPDPPVDGPSLVPRGARDDVRDRDASPRRTSRLRASCCRRSSARTSGASREVNAMLGARAADHADRRAGARRRAHRRDEPGGRARDRRGTYDFSFVIIARRSCAQASACSRAAESKGVLAGLRYPLARPAARPAAPRRLSSSTSSRRDSSSAIEHARVLPLRRQRAHRRLPVRRIRRRRARRSARRAAAHAEGRPAEARRVRDRRACRYRSSSSSIAAAVGRGRRRRRCLRVLRAGSSTRRFSASSRRAHAGRAAPEGDDRRDDASRALAGPIGFLVAGIRAALTSRLTPFFIAIAGVLTVGSRRVRRRAVTEPWRGERRRGA